MRTAVVRINVDPRGELAVPALRERMEILAADAAGAGFQLVRSDVDPNRPELQFLMAGDDAAALRETAAALCARAFGVEPAAGAVTYLSRGTDDDALGVLAGFGLTGQVSRTPGDDGWDVVEVRLAKADLARIPESRIHTALEAALNAEVRLTLY
ncbi:hypothetical protein [Cryptosporangium aurantiacum]|uniref:Uncharacterized protein n=1 Tax=Cryptosporangium aurantiacum TaxID=134849 RepID=A0A1M7KGY9_9ACTN|nr:hypothetical protein [Cryptosporangium aurantiacum]SHM64556.1 hypothetical protein SAMN05443668_1011124 [Cryptosporangium aurantiacum]